MLETISIIAGAIIQLLLFFDIRKNRKDILYLAKKNLELINALKKHIEELSSYGAE